MRVVRFLARPIVAVGLCALSVALVVSAVVIGIVFHHKPVSGALGLSTLVTGAVLLVVGTVVAARRPHNIIGWLVLGGGVFLSFSAMGATYSFLDYRYHHGSWPLGPVALLMDPSWSPAILCAATGVMLFPDGHPPGRVSKWAMGLMLCLGAVWYGGVYWLVLSVVAHHAVHVAASGDLAQVDNPRGQYAWWNYAQGAFFFSVVLAWIVWIVQAIPRYRRSTGEARVQQKWLFSGAVAAIVISPLSIAFSSSSTGWQSYVGALGILAIAALPLSMGIAIMKFHLYDIDRVISRSIAYLAVTGLVVGSYLGLVILGTRVLSFSSPVAVATSTLLLVIAFNPLRKRLQRVVDRRFNRARYDAEALVASFAGQLKDSVDIPTVQRRLVEAVGQAVEPERVFVWLNSESRR